MCKGGNLFLQLIIVSMDQFAYFLDCDDYLELKVADIAISSSSHLKTASIKEI